MDWIGAAVNVTGWYIMPKNRLAASCIFLMSNMIWICWAIGHTTWSIVLLQGCYVFLNVRAIWIWQKSIHSPELDPNNFLAKGCQILSLTNIISIVYQNFWKLKFLSQVRNFFYRKLRTKFSWKDFTLTLLEFVIKTYLRLFIMPIKILILFSRVILSLRSLVQLEPSSATDSCDTLDKSSAELAFQTVFVG